MLKGKQRAYLRSIANTLKPSTQIGKDGVTESFLEQLDDMLRKREIPEKWNCTSACNKRSAHIFSWYGCI